MRRARAVRSPGSASGSRLDPVPARRRWANGWPVLPMRLFLAALFLFAGYAKLSYPRFFDPTSTTGLKASVDAVKHGTPIGGLLGPLSDHPSLFGHITAYAEIAIGLGLLVGLLTRVAALGGMVLTALIVLSINWGGVKEYTGSSGWFTSVDLAVAAALSVFLLGGAGPLALDNFFLAAKERDRARDDDEPGFSDGEYEDSRRRLQGEQYPAGRSARSADETAQLPANRPADYRDGERADYRDGERLGERADSRDGERTGYRDGDRAGYRDGDQTSLRDDEQSERRNGEPASRGASQYRQNEQDEEYRDDPEPEQSPQWTSGEPGRPAP